MNRYCWTTPRNSFTAEASLKWDKSEIRVSRFVNLTASVSSPSASLSKKGLSVYETSIVSPSSFSMSYCVSLRLNTLRDADSVLGPCEIWHNTYCSHSSKNGDFTSGTMQEGSSSSGITVVESHVSKPDSRHLLNIDSEFDFWLTTAKSGWWGSGIKHACLGKYNCSELFEPPSMNWRGVRP